MDLEIGVANRLAAEELVRSGLGGRCLRVMFEPREQMLGEALTRRGGSGVRPRRGGVACPRLLHGVDATAWALLEEAVARGYDSRIGFEDILTLPDGREARSNADLVRAAWTKIRVSP